MHRKPWSPSAIQYLCENWNSGAIVIAKRLGRSEASIRNKARDLGLTRKNNPLTKEDIQTIHELAGTLFAHEIADKINKSVHQVKKYAVDNDLSLHVKKTTPDQEAHMYKLHCEGYTLSEIQKKYPQISVSTIWLRIQDFPVSKKFH